MPPQDAPKPWPFKKMTWAKITPEAFASHLGQYMMREIGDILVEALEARANDVAEAFKAQDDDAAKALKPLDDRVSILEMAKRELQLGCNSEIVSLIEAAMAEHKYCDVWNRGQRYKRHNSVTYKGSLWIAKVDTEEEPGTSAHWRLACKKGRDGK